MFTCIQVAHNKPFTNNIVAQYCNEVSSLGVKVELWSHFELESQYRTRIFSRKVPNFVTVNPVQFLYAFLSFVFLMIKVKPNIVHAHTFRGSLLPLLAGKTAGVPIRIYHNHGFSYLGYSGALRHLMRFVEKVNIWLATDVVSVSASNLQSVIEDRLVDETKIRLIGDGLALGCDLPPISSYKIEKREGSPLFVAGYVGRPVLRKGFIDALIAWELSGLGASGGVLLFAGCSELEVKNYLGRVPVGVDCLGYIDDMNKFYGLIDVLILPSKHEGFPLCIIEAAAYAVPTIANNVSGIRSAVVDKETGVLLVTNTPAELSEKLLYYAENRIELAMLGAAARKRVESKFTKEIVMGHFKDFYLSLTPQRLDF